MDILNLKGLNVDASLSEETDEKITLGFDGRVISNVGPCPQCGFNKVVANGSRRITYKDLPQRGKPVELEWTRTRLLCRNCGTSFPDQHPDIMEERRMTRRLFDWIGERSLSHTFASIAKDIGVDTKTASNVFHDWAKEQENKHMPTPRVLGIDELHIIGKPRGVFTDIGDRKLYAMLPDRLTPTISKFASRIPDRDLIKVVCIDMWKPYAELTRNYFRDADLVIDKWHVQKLAAEALEKMRRSHKGSVARAVNTQMKRDRYMLLKRQWELTPQEWLLVDGMCKAYPDIGDAYAAKELFFDLWKSPTEAAAREGFLHWKDSLSGKTLETFRPVIGAVVRWQDPIFAYFRHGYTNAFTECMNGLIRVTNRTGRGYAFDTLRTRMLLKYGRRKDALVEPFPSTDEWLSTDQST